MACGTREERRSASVWTTLTGYLPATELLEPRLKRRHSNFFKCFQILPAKCSFKDDYTLCFTCRSAWLSDFGGRLIDLGQSICRDLFCSLCSKAKNLFQLGTIFGYARSHSLVKLSKILAL